MTQQQTLQVQSINQQNAGFFSELAYQPIGGTAAPGTPGTAEQSFADKGDGLSVSNFPGWTEIVNVPGLGTIQSLIKKLTKPRPTKQPGHFFKPIPRIHQWLRSGLRLQRQQQHCQLDR
jgi:hypothetical protein